MNWYHHKTSSSDSSTIFSIHAERKKRNAAKKETRIPWLKFFKYSKKNNHIDEKRDSFEKKNPLESSTDVANESPMSSIAATQPHLEQSHGTLHERTNTPLLPPQNHQKVDQQRRESYIPSDDVKQKQLLVLDLTGLVTAMTKYPAFEGTRSNIFKGMWNDTLVAIKVLRGPAMNNQTKEGLRRELPTWCSLEHDNILQIHGYSEDFGKYGAIISPWCSGGNVGEYIQQGQVDVSQRFKLWCDIVEGVAYLHSHEPVVIHGDIKPTNVLVDNDGRAKVCDFGLTGLFSEGMSDYTTPINSSTMRYLANELIVAEEPAIATKASDVWAVGCLGLELVFLKAPYSTRLNPAQIYRDVSKNIPPATDLPLGLEHMRAVWEMINRCWNTDPEVRPSAEDLKAFVKENRTGLTNILENSHIGT